MKPYLLIFSILFSSTMIFSQNVGINEDGSPPNPKAILDVKSTTKGVLIPRMTSAQRMAIQNPPEGLIIFDTDINSVLVTDTSGVSNSWSNLSTGLTLPFSQNISTNTSAFHIGNAGNTPTSSAAEFYGGQGRGLYSTALTAAKFEGGNIGLDVSGGDIGAKVYGGNGKGVVIDMNGWNTKALLVEDGQVGVGTLLPQSYLHIKQQVAGNPVNLIKATGWAGNNGPADSVDFVYKIQQPINAGGNMKVFLGTETNHPLHFITNNNMDTIALTISKSGNIGIKKSDDLSSSLAINGVTKIYNENIYSGEIKGVNNDLWIRAKGRNSGQGDFYKHIILQSYPEEGIIAGNVGIGVTNPQATLEVQNNENGTIPSAIIGNSIFGDNSNITYINDSKVFVNGQNQIGALEIENQGQVIMNVPNSSLCIGTRDSTYKLNVKGIMRSSELIIDSDWADYVFDKNYELKNIEEVEKYIQDHGHLPNVPSAKEIQKEGLKVSEISTKMMEKIEELTLYIIQQQKQIDELKKQIKDIKKQ